MALEDLKFEESDFVNQDISSLPDKVSGQAAFLKAKFDNVGKNLLAMGRFNDLIDILAAAEPCGCRYSNTVAQAIANGGGIVDFATIQSTPYGVNPPTRIAAGQYQINADGKYLIEACIQFALNTAGARGLTILLNSTATLSQVVVPATQATLGNSVCVSTLASLVIGQIISIQAYQSSGGPLNTGTSSVQHISITKLS